MHPAYSIIFFTTSSGLGYGLAAMLGLGLLDPLSAWVKFAHLLALALIAGGLLSSTFHLGNPQRAWRALSQWRSSCLSREGVLAILTFVPLAISAWFAVFESTHLPLIGLLGTAGAIATVYCTSMIYASLRSIQAWNTPLTPACYLLFAGAGGSLLAAFIAACAGQTSWHLELIAFLLLAAAWAAKIQWRKRLSVAPLSTPESATGLGHLGKVRLFERPHTNENYLTREMGFRVARKHAEKLFRIALVAGGGVPAVLLLLSLLLGQGAAAVILALAVLSHALGVLVERWLFFAEARHAVMNYYGG
ncbi:DmsC/YnfH family molybdoenzyme membrane anchor subunit [Aminobacter sp. J44]|uniref:dimethyl sulfoxide reductase anchor subunit family protein n=1 Tax=Aminobacter sp. J44 TaxID=935262 RepID=UPI00119AF8D1|nr:DmsC/YnfH family molybdoenzyme membrane anchor subunit [Aminobacter sp. J44]TWG61445.1 DMSO reductase anchor subunit [Aminobacter sp. J44]